MTPSSCNLKRPLLVRYSPSTTTTKDNDNYTFNGVLGASLYKLRGPLDPSVNPTKVSVTRSKGTVDDIPPVPKGLLCSFPFSRIH